jgi:hypothetical protein
MRLLSPMAKTIKTASHDAPSAYAWSKFMGTGWAPSPLHGISEARVAKFAADRQ